MSAINVLSFIATAGATYFCTLIYQRLTASVEDKLNTCTIWVMASLAWWDLCDAFFYVAPTKELAWFWHRLGAPGWCGFIAVTAWFFLVMIGADQKLKPLLVAILAAFPAALTLRFMLAAPTAMAEDLVQSTSGLGWTYVQRYHTVWPFLFLAYLLLYLGGALFLLYRWQKREVVSSRRRLAKGFIVLDSFVVGFGFLSIFVLPYFTPRFPPAGCIATMLFGLWYWGWLRDFDLLHVELALNPGQLLDSCIDAMVVTDDTYRLLYANTQAKLLLDTSHWEAACYLDYLTSDSRLRLECALRRDTGKSIPLELALNNGTPVMCSASRMTSRRRGMDIWVLCMQDITQLKETQKRLHQIALYDELTGLYNRRSLNDILAQWASAARESGTDFALLFLDLAEFKRINDTFGHKAGDEALLAVSLMLQAVVGQEGVLARFAGDEFVILHWVMDGVDIVPRLHQALSRVDCSAFAPGAAIAVDVGLCRFSEVERGDTDEMLQRADSRMYRNKSARKGQ